MPVHPLVEQLWFARSEFKRCFKGVSEEDATKRLKPSNSLSWIVGHLAAQENKYWVLVAQEKSIETELNDLVGYGKPASTPLLKDMWNAWKHITAEADQYLKTLDPTILSGFLMRKGKPVSESVGTMLLRNTYHYWYHIGEAQALRQQLGHQKLPVFVGRINDAPYRPEA